MAVPSILQRILQRKSEEIAGGKAVAPITELTARAKDCAPARGFENRLRQSLLTELIILRLSQLI